MSQVYLNCLIVIIELQLGQKGQRSKGHDPTAFKADLAESSADARVKICGTGAQNCSARELSLIPYTLFSKRNYDHTWTAFKCLTAACATLAHPIIGEIWGLTASLTL